MFGHLTRHQAVRVTSSGTDSGTIEIVDRLVSLPDAVVSETEVEGPEPWADLADDGQTPEKRGRWHRAGLSRVVVPLLLVCDVLAVVAGGVVSGQTWASTDARAFVVVISFAGFGLYRPRLSVSILEDLPRIALTALLAAFVPPALDQFLPGAERLPHPFTETALLLGVLVGGRALAYPCIRQARRVGLLRTRAVVLGAGEVGIALAHALEDHKRYGLDPVGFIDSVPLPRFAHSLPVPIIGTPQMLSSIIREFDVREVLVAFGAHREVELVQVLRTCDRLRCEIHFIPRLFELHNTTRDVDLVQGIPLIRIRRPSHRTFAWRFKRLIDVAVAGIGLVLLSWLLGAVALAVRVVDGPGVLFRQQRVGLDGREFAMIKFRTLRPVDDAEAATLWSVENDKRVSKLGRWLRRSSLDELPQLWNILVGDMSLVGPRPERPHFVDQFVTGVPRYAERHRVPAGLTGWAQVNDLRGDTSIQQRALYDNYYVENWSNWIDVKILLRTVLQVVRGRGA
jgi:exopolysaccharide biosynthesis polyprenyl glycosylphosphotransferase